MTWRRKNSHLDSLPFRHLDIVNVTSADKRGVKVVPLNMTPPKNFRSSSATIIFRRESRLNSIGEKMIRKLRKSSIRSRTAAHQTRKRRSKKAEQLFRSALNSLKRVRFLVRITLGIVHNVKILFWQRSRCKSTKPLKY